MPPQLRRAFVWLIVSIAVIRLLLAGEYWERTIYLISIPVKDPLFPALLRDPLVLVAALIGPLSIEGLVLWRPTVTRMKMAAAVEIASATILLIHQASFHKATWIVVFWSGWLLAWLAWSAVRRPELIRTCGPLLAQAIVAFFFLGGAVGKWTAGYWSGEAFHDLLFIPHQGIAYRHLRATFDETTLRQIATIYSRTIVIFETAMTGIVLLPPRVASVLILVAGLGLWSSSSVLYEIVFPILGLAAATWHLASRA